MSKYVQKNILKNYKIKTLDIKLLCRSLIYKFFFFST